MTARSASTEDIMGRVDRETSGSWSPFSVDFRPDLQVDCLNCPPTGLVVVSKLDRSSTVLSGKYQAIVDGAPALSELTDENLAHLHKSAGPLDSSEYLAAVRATRGTAARRTD